MLGLFFMQKHGRKAVQMAIFKKKFKAECDSNGTIIAVGREEQNFIDNNGERVHKFELYSSEGWINNNPSTFLGKAIAPSTIVVCWDNWQAYIYNGTNWNIG